MRNLLLASVVVVLASVSCCAGDLIISANGFPLNHRGNGQFTLKQVLNKSTGKLIDCWTQNDDNDGWIASLSGGVLEVKYCRNGDRKSTRLNSSHSQQSRMPSSA